MSYFHVKTVSSIQILEVSHGSGWHVVSREINGVHSLVDRVTMTLEEAEKLAELVSNGKPFEPVRQRCVRTQPPPAKQRIGSRWRTDDCDPSWICLRRQMHHVKIVSSVRIYETCQGSGWYVVAKEFNGIRSRVTDVILTFEEAEAVAELVTQKRSIRKFIKAIVVRATLLSKSRLSL